MTLHYVDPNRMAARECHWCGGRGERRIYTIEIERCDRCNGTGRLEEDGAPDVETLLEPGGTHGLAGWYVRDNPARFRGPLAGRVEQRQIGCMGPYPTQAAALRAARLAILGARSELAREHDAFVHQDVGTSGPDFSGSDRPDELGDGKDEEALGGRW